MVKSFNRTLKTILKEPVGHYGSEWDQYLARILLTYRNTPHDSTDEKPSFLSFGMDCHSPTEVGLSPQLSFTETDYCEEVTE